MRLATVAALSMLWAQSAAAAPITWVMTGPVTDVFGNWVGVLPLGTNVTFTYTWESNTPNLAVCPPGTGVYLATQSANLSVLQFSEPYGGGAILVNAPAGNCGFGLSGIELYVQHSSGPGSQPPGAPPGFPFYEIYAGVSPGNPNASNLTSIMSGVQQAHVSVQSFSGTGFRFTAPVQVVPEPGTIILLGTGLLAVARRRQRSQVARWSRT